ncbi:iron-siderophore ABC transporter substrate-binding protein [Candidatus Protofrankia californiensis]|uniref:iron-siderophore ABC transporter substrate-binding protein n=1 Tax=Candidatus Protofrankia californiensis TaxID=1839754 RepID=UPI0019CFA8FC|nr:iron-siderophore ABC transporter substrate-binding protein [Candidatus Protofrankia californiensis]
MTIDTEKGPVSIDRKPTRVVALTRDYVDTLLVLGIQPVGANRSSRTEGGVYPWQKGLLDAGKATLLNTDVNTDFSLEKVAALRPDLILADWAAEEQYDKLRQIAPTLKLPGDTTWQDRVRTVARATGTDARTEKIVTDAEAEISRVKQKLPGLAGKTFTMALVIGPGQLIVVSDQSDFAVKFFGQLGMNLSAGAKAITDPDGQLSLEKLDAIDADYLLISAINQQDLDDLKKNPIYQRLGAIRDGRVSELDVETIYAVRLPSPLTFPYVFQRIEPTLTKIAAVRS